MYALHRYYTFNGTHAPTGEEQLSLTRTKVIFNISGTQAAPVIDITIRGLTIRDAAFTYLGTTAADRHWLPSEGDWALQRSGAITIEVGGLNFLGYKLPAFCCSVAPSLRATTLCNLIASFLWNRVLRV